MKEETRRAIAHAAVSRISPKHCGTVYSYHTGRHTHMSGSAANAYDHDSPAHITGSGSSLYHHGNQAHINLSISGAIVYLKNAYAQHTSAGTGRRSYRDKGTDLRGFP